MVTKSQQILWVGSTRDEFQPILTMLRQQGSLQLIATLEQAANCAEPNYLILGQDRPGDLQFNRMHDLLASSNVARGVIVLGGWCSGQKRLQPAARIPLIYAHEGPRAVRQAMLEDGQPPAASITTTFPALIAIYSPVASYRDALADTLACWGMKTVDAATGRAVSVRGVDIVIWDSTGSASNPLRELQAIRKQHPHAKMIALSTYPREFARQILNRQHIEVLAAPFALEQLAAAIELTPQRAVTAAA